MVRPLPLLVASPARNGLDEEVLSSPLVVEEGRGRSANRDAAGAGGRLGDRECAPDPTVPGTINWTRQPVFLSTHDTDSPLEPGPHAVRAPSRSTDTQKPRAGLVWKGRPTRGAHSYVGGMRSGFRIPCPMYTHVADDAQSCCIEAEQCYSASVLPPKRHLPQRCFESGLPGGRLRISMCEETLAMITPGVSDGLGKRLRFSYLSNSP